MMDAISIGLVIQLTLRISTGIRVYDVQGGSLDWYNANQLCLNQEYLWYDFTLATIGTDDDYAALLDAKDFARPRRIRIADDVPFWVGLYRQASGDFAWADGTACETNDGLCVSDWLITPDLDNYNEEYCVALTVDGTTGLRGYKAVSCHAELRYVCSFINGTTESPLHDEDQAIGNCGADTYAINGGQCRVNGDPHFTTWSGARHDYMGNPQILYSQFYYIAPCYDANAQDLPFTMVGNHYFGGWGQATILDYVTLELFKNSYGPYQKYDKYYLWLSSHTQAYIDVMNSDDAIHRDNPAYDYHKIDTDLVTIAANAYQAIGTDGRFEVKYTKSGQRIEVWLKIDGVQQVHFTMQGMYNRDGRNRMHSLVIDVPTNYRCFICGLCGDFQRTRPGGSHDELITCKGGLETYQSGWSASNAFAYDLHGNTWGFEYVNEQCPLYELDTRANARRRLIADEDLIYTPDVGPDFVYVSPCDASIEQQVITACQAARDASSVNCVIVGSEVCDTLQTNCELDACAMSGTDTGVIDANVQIAFTEELQFEVDNQNAAAHKFVANQIDDSGQGMDINYNDYKPNQYPNNSGVFVQVSSTWIFGAGVLLFILLTINCIYMCYVNTSQQRGRGYAAVKYAESEYDDSEAPIIEAPIIQHKK